ncbi:substrate-binding domain-containing protein [Vallitalea sp.]|jgi:ribose transport system substrate-binding protein|uniref:substrate-binding domain-containing protein n=1 Tax=Vallitalea sp. TaxID=1882829 RepID=UPI0025D3DD5F|nr:substrate-binding domain-containing protein [Vallitalea sp.]MCT4687353.1 substrate-binding domain-containing protein [Vallitalea sp.]
MKKFFSFSMVLVMAILIIGCGSNKSTEKVSTDKEQTQSDGEEKTKIDRKYKIGVSLPSPANQWVGAIIDYAKKEAQKDSEEFDIKIVVSDNPAAQVAAIEDLLQDELDAMVVLPLESAPLTPICESVYDKGIPLLVLDRGIASDKYNSFLAGDNYGIGRAAAHYIAKELGGKGNVVEMLGVPCEIVQLRSDGFNDTIKKYYPDINIVARATGNFSREVSLKAMEDILQAQSSIDAVYSHDDEQTLGIKLAVENAGRQDEMFLTGAGGNKGIYQEMLNGNKLIRASFTYSPTMGGSAIRVAKKLAKGEGLEDTLEKEVPRQIILNASTVTSDNVKKFYDEDSSY